MCRKRLGICLICNTEFQGYDKDMQSCFADTLSHRFQVFSKLMKLKYKDTLDFRQVSFPFCLSCNAYVVKMHAEYPGRTHQIISSVTAKMLSTWRKPRKIEDTVKLDDDPSSDKIYRQKIQFLRWQIVSRYSVSVKMDKDSSANAALVKGTEHVEESSDESDEWDSTAFSAPESDTATSPKRVMAQDGANQKKLRVENTTEVNSGLVNTAQKSEKIARIIVKKLTSKNLKSITDENAESSMGQSSNTASKRDILGPSVLQSVKTRYLQAGTEIDNDPDQNSTTDAQINSGVSFVSPFKCDKNYSVDVVLNPEKSSHNDVQDSGNNNYLTDSLAKCSSSSMKEKTSPTYNKEMDQGRGRDAGSPVDPFLDYLNNSVPDVDPDCVEKSEANTGSNGYQDTGNLKDAKPNHNELQMVTQLSSHEESRLDIQPSSREETYSLITPVSTPPNIGEEDPLATSLNAQIEETATITSMNIQSSILEEAQTGLPMNTHPSISEETPTFTRMEIQSIIREVAPNVVPMNIQHDHLEEAPIVTPLDTRLNIGEETAIMSPMNIPPYLCEDAPVPNFTPMNVLPYLSEDAPIFTQMNIEPIIGAKAIPPTNIQPYLSEDAPIFTPMNIQPIIHEAAAIGMGTEVSIREEAMDTHPNISKEDAILSPMNTAHINREEAPIITPVDIQTIIGGVAPNVLPMNIRPNNLEEAPIVPPMDIRLNIGEQAALISRMNILNNIREEAPIIKPMNNHTIVSEEAPEAKPIDTEPSIHEEAPMVMRVNTELNHLEEAPIILPMNTHPDIREEAEIGTAMNIQPIIHEDAPIVAPVNTQDDIGDETPIVTPEITFLPSQLLSFMNTLTSSEG